MSTANGGKIISVPASADVSSYQYCIAYLDAANTVTFAAGATGDYLGIFQDNSADAAGKPAQVMIDGVSKLLAGGVVAAGSPVTSTSAGRGTTASTAESSIGIAMTAGAATGNIIDVVIQKQNNLI